MEAPVVRSTGRPRKRMRKEEGNGTDDRRVGPEAKLLVTGTKPVALVGRYVLKKFHRKEVFLGKVVHYDCGLYRVNYEDGECEDLDSSEIRGILISDSDHDDCLNQRRHKLDELILYRNVRIADRLEISSVGANKVDCKVEAPASSELQVENDEVQVEGDCDSLSDSSAVSKEQNSGSEAETPPVPPLLLPPSSGTIGVPEPYVSHLFLVYGFLRSFSIRLFLSPFSLDDFVGSLNCQVSNTLFDAIHVSLMRALRCRLETMSSEGSKLASKCLRCNDWSLLDILTWPVFVVQYLVVNEYTKGPEWKEFYDEILNGEYYLLPVSRKLIILQILCDDVLESEELRAEMNMRKESEVGTDYDADDIIPAESTPRRVHPRYAKTSACKDKEVMKFVSESNAVKFPSHSIPNFSSVGRKEDGDVDRNGDECQLCGMDGTLLCCDGCPSAYHSRCIGVMKTFIPEGPWYCPECKINMTGPTIAKRTSLRGAELFGNDVHGQLFLGTCNHLLVLNVNGEFCLRYYNHNDIPKVLQVLYASIQHRPLYYGIGIAVLQYWNIPANVLPFSVTTGSNVNPENIKDNAKFSHFLPPTSDEEDHTAVNLVEAEFPVTASGKIDSGNMVSSLDTSFGVLKTEVFAPKSCSDSSNSHCSVMKLKLPEDAKIESVISTGSVSHQTDLFVAKHQISVDRFGRNDMRLLMSSSLGNKEVNQAGAGTCEHNFNNDTIYSGSSYKPISYINCYMHGDLAASAAAKWAVLSSEDSRSDSRMSGNLRKITSGNTYMQAKAFSQTVSRFFWPSSERKLVEVPRERCGWCLSCKAPASSKKGCMLNHAALSATKSATKILAGLGSVRSGEGILPSIAMYIIYLEESLHGLVVGPFLTASYRKQWRRRLEQAITFSAAKPLLLELEENIRAIAFSGDWFKLMEDWLVESSIIQSAACTVGTTQKRAQIGRHYKKHSTSQVTADHCRENNFTWWHGGNFTKFVFQKAMLPKIMVRKAARQGGIRKIFGISYTDSCEIPKRSRQLVWRAAVEMSRNAAQLALQVRNLDFHLRWSDLIRPEQNLQDGKGQESEASAFRNARICDNKLAEGKILYGIALGSQKLLPSRVIKGVVEIEQGPEGNEKYWFSETRIPLYLVKEYEEGVVNMASEKEHLNLVSQLQKRKNLISQSHRRQLKAKWKDIFFYLTCKRDNLDISSCSVCQLGVLIGKALKCSACQGYCHEGCTINSTVSTDKEVFLSTCKQCYAKLHCQKEASNVLSPTSPSLLQGREHSSMTVLKGPRAKCKDQTLTATRTKDIRPDMKHGASASTLATKSRCRNSTWGVIYKKDSKKEGSAETGIDFRLKNILLKGSSHVPQPEPECYSCQKPYRSDLMYILCETCKSKFSSRREHDKIFKCLHCYLCDVLVVFTDWYHAEAVELEESRLSHVLGFKCCRCRRIRSSVCPYSETKGRMSKGIKTHTGASKEHSGAASDSGTISELKESEDMKTHTRASKKEHCADSDSRTLSELTERGPTTPVFPREDVSRGENDPSILPLSNGQLITPSNPEIDVKWNTACGLGLQKLPVKRHVKCETDDDCSFGGISNDMRNLSKPAEKASSPSLEYHSAVLLHSNHVKKCDTVNDECMAFEPLSVTELLLPDDNTQSKRADASGDMLGYLKNSYSQTGFPAKGGTASLINNSALSTSLQGSVYSCWQCSQTEPAPDLSCEVCGLWIHSQCSPWFESPSSSISWRCGNCREWR